MIRDFSALSKKIFDIAIIGGGINGAAVAWDAALRGLSVALIDKGDFGSGSTAGNFRTIHGGLRYLQHMNLPRLYESVEEQRIFRLIAPHLVRPLPFLVPCYGYGMRSREILKVALTIYEVLSSGRNRDIHSRCVLPKSRMLSVEETLSIAPGLRRKGLRGGVVYYDALMSDADRLTLSFVLSADAKGCVCVNYVKAIDFKTSPDDGHNIQTMRVRDELTGEVSEIKAKLFVNATGPWSREILKLLPNRYKNDKPIFSKGVQVVLPKIVTEAAVAIESAYGDREAYISRGNRSYFLLPWNGVTLAGTADALYTGDVDDAVLEREICAEFIRELGELYSSELISPENVKRIFGGLRPVSPSAETAYRENKLAQFGTIEVAHHDEIIDHDAGSESIKNLITMVGVKYTSVRNVAQKVVDLACRKLAREELKCSTHKTALVTAPQSDSEFESEYGHHQRKVDELIAQDNRLNEILDTGSNIKLAHVVYSVNSECAVKLSDVIFRRTTLAGKTLPEKKVIVRAAQTMGKMFDWEADRVQSEIAEVIKEVSQVSMCALEGNVEESSPLPSV